MIDESINLNSYRVFYICTKCSSFVEASKILCVSQPAVSKQIKNLEEALGTKLFYRTSSGLSLTNDGNLLANYIEKSYNYLLAGEKIIKENNNINSGAIVIGAPGQIASFYLLDFIEEYRLKYPNVFFRIINGSTHELLDGLKNHKIDFVIDSSPINTENKDIKIIPLTSFETCFITSKDNKNNSLENEKYIMPYKRSSIRKNLEKELEKRNISLNVVLEVETTDLIISSVKKGIGTGYVVKQIIKKDLENKELKELKTSFDLPKLEVNLLYIEEYLTNLSKYFIKNYIKK